MAAVKVYGGIWRYMAVYGGMGNVCCTLLYTLVTFGLLSDLFHLVASPKRDKSCQLNKDSTKLWEASRKRPQNTSKYFEPENLIQSSSETASERRIKSYQTSFEPAYIMGTRWAVLWCACPSRSSSHWRVPLPSASSTSKRPSQSGTCPESEANLGTSPESCVLWHSVTVYCLIRSDQHWYWHPCPEIHLPNLMWCKLHWEVSFFITP